MARTLCIPASVLLLAALLLNLLVSISLPSLSALDIVRIHNARPSILPANITSITEARLGIWSLCDYLNTGTHVCAKKALGYEVAVINFIDTPNLGIITSAWTRGLIMHPIATGFIFIAFITSFSTALTLNLVAFLVSSFAALITLVAFAIDIAFFVQVRNVFKDVNNGVNAGVTKTGPGFWLAFVSFVLLLLASLTFCVGRHREGRSSQNTSYPMETSKSGKFWAKINQRSF